MAIALDPRDGGKEETTYIVAAEQSLDEEQQTRWIIRPLSEGEWARVLDVSMRPDSGVATISMETLRYGLVRVENFKDKSGADIEVQRVFGKTTDGFLSRIAWPYRIEIADQVQRLSKLDEDDVEKPEPSPTS